MPPGRVRERPAHGPWPGRAEGEAVQRAAMLEPALDHPVQRKIGAQRLLVEGEAVLLQLFRVVADIPGLQRLRAADALGMSLDVGQVALRCRSRGAEQP